MAEKKPQPSVTLRDIIARRPETTRLSPPEELAFRVWAAENGIADVDQPGSYYDYRGYWREHGNAPINFGTDHFTDTYKQHGHPTFSVESQYSRGLQDGGQWLTEDVQMPAPVPSHTPNFSSAAPADGSQWTTLGMLLSQLGAKYRR